MKKPNKTVSGLVGLLLLPSCNLPPNPPKQPVLDPILPSKPTLTDHYNKIIPRAVIVVGSLKKNFPGGLVVYFKGKNKENDRYIALMVSDHTLNLTIYRCSDPRIKEKLQEFYLRDQTHERIFYSIDATNILDVIYDIRVEFNDIPHYGIRFPEDAKELGDYVKTQAQGEKEIRFKEGRLIQEGVIKEDNSENLEDHLERLNLLLLDALTKLTLEEK